ncbi:SEC-C domain-containing protein [Listeria monocytogenes]|nr:SEC-C domain-containing protein [Listeria monocytogenes]HAO5607383.1 SEC-C domain-containing protein [Listeria monocytogenes]HAO6512635.1 SEC-C domain-containing protein [Listeria monocytogenes]
MEYTSNGGCPCGSGKKYKKCCKDEDESIKNILIKVEIDLFLEMKYQVELKDDLSFQKDGIEMKIDVDSDKIFATKRVYVSGLVEKTLLKEYISFSDLMDNIPEKTVKEINDLPKSLIKAIEELVAWLDLALLINQPGDLIKNVRDFIYDDENQKWIKFPQDIKGSATIKTPRMLNKLRKEFIQKELDNGVKPFKAFIFLKHAKHEENLSVKWINATIAAELAIKEFFLRYNPQLKYIVTEMPAPPLYKMYRGMLESVTDGFVSSKWKELKEGAEKRNSLVHNPRETELNEWEVIKYINDVETAIFELVNLLDEDSIFYKDYEESQIVAKQFIEVFKNGGLTQKIVMSNTNQEVNVPIEFD